MENEIKIVAGYCRTSGDDPEDKRANGQGKQSIKNQQTAVKEIAKKLDAKLIATFTDADRSGRTYPDSKNGNAQANLDIIFQDYAKKHIRNKPKRFRTGLASLLKILPDIDAVVMRDDMRLMRPLNESQLAAFVIAQLKIHNVKIITETKTLDPNSPNDMLVYMLTTRVQDSETQERVRNATTALISLRNSGGLYTSPTCFGYRSKGKQKIEAIENEIKIIKKIYSDFLKKMSLTAIAYQLNFDGSSGIKNGDWTKGSVRRILKNPRYAGMQFNTDGVLIKCIAFQPLAAVSLGDYRKAQQRLQKNKELNLYDRTTKIHPMCCGVVLCGMCQNPMYIKSGGGSKYGYTRYFVCSSAWYKKQETDCSSCRIRDDSYSNADPNKLSKWGLEMSLLPLTKIAFDERCKLSAAKEELIEQAEVLEHKLGELSDRDNVAALAFANGNMDSTTLQTVSNVIKSKRAGVAKELEIIKQDIATATPPPEQLRWDFANKLIKNPALARELVAETFEKILVYPEFVSIHLRNGGEFVLYRVQIGNSRAMPLGVSTYDKQDRLHIEYRYKSFYEGDTSKKLLYKSDNLFVWSVGK